ncbi:MAG: DUF4157 domain-containing protein [Alicyclobacillus sp.]|nr:DUF4157 domain-containing protein [Alicyclobacillus sp.]
MEACALTRTGYWFQRQVAAAVPPLKTGARCTKVATVAIWLAVGAFLGNLAYAPATVYAAEVDGVVVTAGEAGIDRAEIRQVAALVEEASRDVLRPSLGIAPGLPLTDTLARPKIVLLSSPSGYARVAQSAFPAAQATTAAAQTGGFTVGETIFIPLYKYQDDSFLLNTVAHELTHVVLNAKGLGPVLPSWINEGYAWYNGFAAQSLLNPQAVEETQTSLWSQLSAAWNQGDVKPLSASPDSVLAPEVYSTEYQDYVAVRQLIRDGSLERFRRFLTDAKRFGADAGFQRVYGESLDTFTHGWEPVHPWSARP